MRLLLDQLNDAARDSRLYACVDLASAPNALHRIAADSRDQRCLFKGALVDGGEQVAPWLVAMNPLSLRPMIERTVRLACQAPALSWIASSLELDALACRLRRRIDVELPANESVILRYFDPRILQVLSECLTSEQRRAFFALGSQWLFIDREQTAQSIELVAPDGVDPVDPPFRLEDAQEAALIDASEAGQLVGTALERAPLLLTSMSPGERFRVARRCAQALIEIDIDAFPAKLALFMVAAPSSGAYLDSVDWQRDRLRLQSNAIDFAGWLDELAEKEDVV